VGFNRYCCNHHYFGSLQCIHYIEHRSSGAFNTVDRPARIATVILFTNDWQYIDAKVTDDSGCTEPWSDLKPGLYNLNVHSPGTDGALWSSRPVSVSSGRVTTVMVKRYMPYILQLPGIPSKANVSSTLGFELDVVNGSTDQFKVRVEVYIDKDKTEPWDWQQVLEKNIPGNASQTYSFSYSPDRTGNYNVALRVYTLFPWSSEWQLTDLVDWDYELKIVNR